MVYSILKSGTTGKNLGKRYPLSENDTRNKMAAKFKTDGARLARDNADVLIDEAISYKVLSYSDSNSKLKVIGVKLSIKNIIPDMGHGSPH